MICTATDDDIINYLSSVKSLIKENKNNLIVSLNREKNTNFINKYGLKKNRIIEIIDSLDKDDFEDKVMNRHTDYSDEVLYIFSKTFNLTDSNGKLNTVEIYIKFNLTDKKVILISFHEAEYEFKEKK